MCTSFVIEDESWSTNAKFDAKSKHMVYEFDPQQNSTSGTLWKVKQRVTSIFASIGLAAPTVPTFGLSSTFAEYLVVSIESMQFCYHHTRFSV